jgi:hypothetical protein
MRSDRLMQFDIGNMRRFKRPSIIESAVLLAVAVLLSALIFIPDSGTAKRREIERRAHDWVPGLISAPSEGDLIATGVDLSGEWTNEGPYTHTSFRFSNRRDVHYDAAISTGGCLGGCDFSRSATMYDGLIRLNSAVAEYDVRTYDTLFAIRVGENHYLLPADSVPDFERSFVSESDDWIAYVFRRADSDE